MAGTMPLAAVDPLAGADVLGEPSVYWERPLARGGDGGLGRAGHGGRAARSRPRRAARRELSAPDSVRWLGEAARVAARALVRRHALRRGGSRDCGLGGVPASGAGRCRRLLVWRDGRAWRLAAFAPEGAGRRGRGALAAGSGVGACSRTRYRHARRARRRCGSPRRAPGLRGRGWSARWRRSRRAASRRWCWRGRWRSRAERSLRSSWTVLAAAARAEPALRHLPASGRRTARPSWAPRPETLCRVEGRPAGDGGAGRLRAARAGRSGWAAATRIGASTTRWCATSSRRSRPLSAERGRRTPSPRCSPSKQRGAPAHRHPRASCARGWGRREVVGGAAPDAGGGRHPARARAGASSRSTRRWTAAGTPGPVGWVGPTRAHLVVALRSALVRGPRPGSSWARGSCAGSTAEARVARDGDEEPGHAARARRRTMSDANLNQLWARALVEELVRGGVRHAVVCPGSRSSPLALAVRAGGGAAHLVRHRRAQRGLLRARPRQAVAARRWCWWPRAGRPARTSTRR